MKKYLFCSIALLVIFTISGVYCNSTDLNCVKDFDQCLQDSDCCNKKCLMTGNIKNRFCLEPHSALLTIDPAKIQNGKCSYYEPTDKIAHQYMLESFGLFASHPLLPINSLVEVNHNDKTVMVTISSQILESKNNSILELSREAAKELGIEREGLFDCNLQLVVTDEDYYPLLKPIGVIVFYVLAMFLLV